MYFKDRNYYIAKTKEVLGMLAGSTVFAMFIVLMVALA